MRQLFLGFARVGIGLSLFAWSAAADAQAAPEVQTAPAHAPAAPTRERERWMPARLSADPNGPCFGFEYRGAVRGRFADTFDLYGGAEQAGYGIAIVPLFELHEPLRSRQVLPSQYWRARLSLEQSYGLFTPTRRVRVALLLNHESDHETAHPYSKPGFLALNDVTVRATFAQRHEHWAFSAGFDVQGLVVSCTEPSRPCRNFRGDSSVGGQAQLGLALTGLQLWRFSPFATASASGILPHGLVELEGRVSARIGIYAWLGDSLLSLFMLVWIGDDVGVTRSRSLTAVGAGASFAR